jgi:hypothetical protein
LDHIKRLQQQGNRLSCEYIYESKKYISFYCQFIIFDDNRVSLYDFKTQYSSDENHCICTVDPTKGCWLPSRITALSSGKYQKPIESKNIRMILNLPPLQKPMSKLQTLMIDSYLKDKKNLKRITDFTNQLKLKGSILRDRREQMNKERSEIVDEIDKNDQIFSDLEEAIEE